MTVKLLVDWVDSRDGKNYLVGNLLTTDAGTESGLVAARLATSTLTGGTAYAPPVVNPLNSAQPALLIRDLFTGMDVIQSNGKTYYLGRGVIANECPNTLLTDASSGGIGTTLSQIGFVTVPGGVMKPKSKIVVNCALGLTGNDSKTITLRAGPASGTFATATGFCGQAGLTTQLWAPLTALIWNNGTTSSQKASPANLPNYMSSTANPIVSMSIDTSLDWNIYFGVQSSIANGAPSNTFTLLEYFVELVG